MVNPDCPPSETNGPPSETELLNLTELFFTQATTLIDPPTERSESLLYADCRFVAVQCLAAEKE